MYLRLSCGVLNEVVILSAGVSVTVVGSVAAYATVFVVCVEVGNTAHFVVPALRFWFYMFDVRSRRALVVDGAVPFVGAEVAAALVTVAFTTDCVCLRRRQCCRGTRRRRHRAHLSLLPIA